MTTIAVKIAVIAGLAMPLSFGTAFAGGLALARKLALNTSSFSG